MFRGVWCGAPACTSSQIWRKSTVVQIMRNASRAAAGQSDFSRSSLPVSNGSKNARLARSTRKQLAPSSALQPLWTAFFFPINSEECVVVFLLAVSQEVKDASFCFCRPAQPRRDAAQHSFPPQPSRPSRLTSLSTLYVIALHAPLTLALPNAPPLSTLHVSRRLAVGRHAGG